MSKSRGLDYTLESRRYGTVVANISKKKVPDFLHEFVDTKSSGEFIAVIRRLPGDLRIEANGSDNGWEKICFRDYGDPYTERGMVWLPIDQDRAVFFLTPRASGLSKSQLFEILDQAEKAVEENAPSR